MIVHPASWGATVERAFGIAACPTCAGSGSALVLGVRLACPCRPFAPASASPDRWPEVPQ